VVSVGPEVAGTETGGLNVGVNDLADGLKVKDLALALSLDFGLGFSAGFGVSSSFVSVFFGLVSVVVSSCSVVDLLGVGAVVDVGVGVDVGTDAGVSFFSVEGSVLTCVAVGSDLASVFVSSDLESTSTFALTSGDGLTGVVVYTPTRAPRVGHSLPR